MIGTGRDWRSAADYSIHYYLNNIIIIFLLHIITFSIVKTHYRFNMFQLYTHSACVIYARIHGVFEEFFTFADPFPVLINAYYTY